MYSILKHRISRSLLCPSRPWIKLYEDVVFRAVVVILGIWGQLRVMTLLNLWANNGSSLFYVLNFYLYIYLFLAIPGLLCCFSPVECGDYSPDVGCGLPLWRLLSWQSKGSRHAAFSGWSTQAQQLRLTGFRAQAQQSACMGLLLHSAWGLPGSGVEFVSSTSAGGFFTTESPGEPLATSF